MNVNALRLFCANYCFPLEYKYGEPPLAAVFRTLRIFLILIAADDKDFDLLKFWKVASIYPNLKILAAWVLSIPASSASDERVFLTHEPR